MTTQLTKHVDPVTWPAPPMTPEEGMLVVLRDELYGGSWERMLQDLRDRRRGRPYIFKLVNHIQTDIDRIERLQERGPSRAIPGAAMRTGPSDIRGGWRTE